MDERMRNQFAKNLRKYMELRDKTQADLYRYMHVSSATASDWCNGVKMPRADKLQSIANWLGVELAVLLGEKEEPESYFLDDYARELAQFIHDNPEYRTAFSAARKVPPEDLEAIIAIINKNKGVQ